MIQLGRDLLVVNRFPPYPRFEAWEPVIHDALATYRKLADPKGISRVGLRYINRIVIPEAKIRMEDYFTIYPQLPPAFGERHGSFLVRVEVPAESGQHSVKITFGSAPPPGPDAMAFLLDLYDIRDGSCDFEKFEGVVKAAHQHVVDSFEGGITEKLREIFRPRDRSA